MSDNDNHESFAERIGVGRPHPGLGARPDSSRTTTVVADDGPMRGKPVGTKTEHSDGRVDATARVQTYHHRKGSQT